jgi:hypothetical protein
MSPLLFSGSDSLSNHSNSFANRKKKALNIVSLLKLPGTVMD